MLNRISKYGMIACIALAGLAVTTTTGCGTDDPQARKLDAPEDIDWAAIEAEGEAMAESQKVGE